MVNVFSLPPPLIALMLHFHDVIKSPKHPPMISHDGRRDSDSRRYPFAAFIFLPAYNLSQSHFLFFKRAPAARTCPPGALMHL